MGSNECGAELKAVDINSEKDTHTHTVLHARFSINIHVMS